MTDVQPTLKVEPGDVHDASRPVFELFEGFALTSVLASLERAGLLARLEGGNVPADPGDGEDGLPLATLRYLAQRGIVEESDGTFSLSERGRAVTRDKGYLVWLQGGYGHVLAALGDFSTGAQRYGSDVIRDGRWVADGSALIGRDDVSPHATAVLETIDFSHVVDLGCGNARFLIAAANRFGVTGVGVDLAPEACEDAEHAIAAADLSDSVKVRCGDAGDLDAIPELAEADLAVAFFLLHEIFEHGRDALMSYLRKLGSIMPRGAHMLVAEVQPASGAQHERWRPEFTLLHAIMRQQLLTEEGWHDAFVEAGWARKEVRELGLPGAVLLLYENLAPGRDDAEGGA
ncbi:cyclopropane-fatty-acyl-phospholipid synthase family protein [Conexibacter sp. CPCC 206217]|uniref:SAM-dependent methyltransferase n=1 Tax=Conexibacter sp. CPCC 206217 TaxID=3064574 RepID=UPI00271EDC2F|nr:class I SAM-dependent methyltransferase [Conexibacter sp. CPCC 206217]MDO8213389.1 class I SAM-dependent methyltransferase [Conexibacter sp. CPCC 206217]